MLKQRPNKTRSVFISITVLTLFLLIGVSAQQAPPWAPNTSYIVGAQVTYQGSTYQCRQAHTSLPGWEPPNVPALWQLVTGGGGGGGDTQAPTIPTNFRVTATTSSSISLAWNGSTDNVGVTGYDVLRGGTLIGTSPTTSFTATGLPSSSTFTFTVRARDAAGNLSAASNAINGTTQSGGGTQPSPWASNTSYAVGTRVSYQGSTYECRQSHTSLLGWEPATTPALWLLVTGGGGGGGGDTQAPTAPGNLRVTATTSTSVSLAWNASSDNVGVTGYDVFRSTTPVGGTAITSFTVTGLSANTTYNFTVRAKDAAGNVSSNSNTVTATTPGDPPPPPPPPPPGGKRIVGYFAQWGIYGRQYFVKNVDTSGSAAKLTHINYAFANIVNNRPLVGVTQQGVGDAWADYIRSTPAGESVDGAGDLFNTPLRGNWGQLKKLKVKYPNLKVMISLGGWSWSGGFSDAALPQNRQSFVAECIRVFIDGDLPLVDGAGGPGALAGVFDGIDLDWEYPIGICVGQPGCMSRPEDPQNFVELVAEFRRQLDIKGGQNGKRYELTAAVAAGIDKIERMVIAPLVSNLDCISVMTFDFFGGFNATGPTAFQSALFGWSGMPSTPPLNNYYSDFAIQQWKSRGFPANKLLLAVPFYGRGWTGVTNANNGLNQPAQGPAPGDFPEEPGVKAYKNLKLLGYPAFRHSEAQAYWIFNGSTFWSFDDPVSITNKANYVKAQGLGGMMFWNLTDDTVNGELITAISNGLQ